MSDGCRHAPRITGIIEQLDNEMTADLTGLEKKESDQGLMKAKTQEISVLTIEEKTIRQASLTVEVQKTDSEFSEDGTTLLPSDMVTLLKAEQREKMTVRRHTALRVVRRKTWRKTWLIRLRDAEVRLRSMTASCCTRMLVPRCCRSQYLNSQSRQELRSEMVCHRVAQACYQQVAPVLRDKVAQKTKLSSEGRVYTSMGGSITTTGPKEIGRTHVVKLWMVQADPVAELISSKLEHHEKVQRHRVHWFRRRPRIRITGGLGKRRSGGR